MKWFSLVVRDIQVEKVLLGMWFSIDQLRHIDVRQTLQYWTGHQILNEV